VSFEKGHPKPDAAIVNWRKSIKIKPNFRSGTNDNPNEPTKAGASVKMDSKRKSGTNDNPNEPPKAGASVSID